MTPINLDGWPVDFSASVSRQTIILRVKQDVIELKECTPTLVKRERSFGRIEKLDKFHLFPDGSVRHTPIP
jgi:hypothetical protein